MITTNINWINQFISYMFPLDPSQVRVEPAFYTKNPHIPDTIYKYRSFENEFDIINLEYDEIWLSDPNNFNDPFDSVFSYDTNRVVKYYIKTQIDQYLKMTGFDIEIPDEKLKLIKESDNPNELIFDYFCKRYKLSSNEIDDHTILRGKMKDEMNDLLLCDFVNKIRNSLKVCCFSEDIFSNTMWSYYSNDHTGFCIEYDMETLPNRDFRRRFLYPVIYIDILFDATDYMINATNQNNIFYLSLSSLIKSKEWEHEKEWRLIFPNNIIEKEESYPMPNIKSIYLGYKATEENKKIIIDIAKQKNIPVYQMEISFNEKKLKAKSI